MNNWEYLEACGWECLERSREDLWREPGSGPGGNWLSTPDAAEVQRGRDARRMAYVLGYPDVDTMMAAIGAKGRGKTEERLIAQAREKGYVVACTREKRVPLLKLVAKGLMVEVSPGTFKLAPRSGEEKST